MSDPDHTSAQIEAGVEVRVAGVAVGTVLRASGLRPDAWYVQWPNGLVTTEYEATLVRASATEEKP